MTYEVEYFNLDGEPITRDEWVVLFELREEYGRVARTVVGDVEVSTVWLGLNHRFGDGPPLIFETMTFGPERRGDLWTRYSTYHDAEVGHARAVARLAATSPRLSGESDAAYAERCLRNGTLEA